MIQTFSEKKERKLFKPCRRHLCQGGFRGRAESPWHCRQQGSQSWRPPQSWWTEKDYGGLPLESIIYLLQISVLVQVSVADTISMSKDWNGLGALLDWLHQLVAPTGDDQVYVAVQLGGKSMIRIRSKNLPWGGLQPHLSLTQDWWHRCSHVFPEPRSPVSSH